MRLVKNILFALVLTLVAKLVALPSCAIANPIRVGISLPLSGPASTYGTDIKNILEFANQELGAKRYELIFEDDKCAPKEAVTIAHKFTGVEKVDFVLGFPCSGTIMASAPIYEKNKLLTMTILASAPEVSQAGDYIFRARSGDNKSMQLLAKEAAGLHQRVGVLSEQTDYCQSMKKVLLEELGKTSVKVSDEDYLSDSTDYRPELLRMKTAKVDAIVVLAQTEQAAALAAKQIREVKAAPAIYGSNAMASAAFVKLAGEVAEGIKIASLPPVSDALTQSGCELFKKYTKRYGPLTSVDYSWYCAFEAFRSMDIALRKGGDLRDTLYSQQFDGVFGPYHFDKNGDLVGVSSVLRLIKGGKFVDPNGGEGLKQFRCE